MSIPFFVKLKGNAIPSDAVTLIPCYCRYSGWAPLLNIDGSISRQPAVECVDGFLYPSLAVSALQMASRDILDDGSLASVQIERGSGFFAPPQRLTLNSYPGLAIPLDNEGNFRISYSKHPSSYIAVSAADVLDGSADVSMLKNSWVLVGATAFGLDDVVPTPYSGAAPGV